MGHHARGERACNKQAHPEANKELLHIAQQVGCQSPVELAGSMGSNALESIGTLPRRRHSFPRLSLAGFCRIAPPHFPHFSKRSSNLIVQALMRHVLILSGGPIPHQWKGKEQSNGDLNGSGGTDESDKAANAISSPFFKVPENSEK